MISSVAWEIIGAIIVSGGMCSFTFWTGYKLGCRSAFEYTKQVLKRRSKPPPKQHRRFEEATVLTDSDILEDEYDK